MAGWFRGENLFHPQGFHPHPHLCRWILCVYLVLPSSCSELCVESDQFYPTTPAFGPPIGVTPFKFHEDL